MNEDSNTKVEPLVSERPGGGAQDSSAEMPANRLLTRRLLQLALIVATLGATTAMWLRTGDLIPKTTNASQSAAAAKPVNIAENQVHGIHADGDRVWVATSGGVIQYDRGTLKTVRKYSSRDGLSHDFVEHVFTARDGRTWFCTFNQNISLFDGREWTTLLPTGEHGPLREEGTRFVLQDRRGLMWISSARQGVFTYDGASWKNYTAADGLPDDSVRTICEDRDGSIWICTKGGVAQLAHGRLIRHTTSGGLSHGDVWTCVIDDQGVKWFGTWGGGINRYDGRRFTVVRNTDGLASNWVFSGKKDARGRLWFGTFQGVSVWDGKTWRSYGPEQGLLGTDVYAVEIDADDYKWFGTFQGVSRLAPDDVTFTTIVRP